jgi:hypothetical protein
VVRSLREQFLIGVTGLSYPAATVEQVDAGLAKCVRALASAHPVRARNLRGDIDKLLDRRTELANRPAAAPRRRRVPAPAEGGGVV